MPKFAKINWVLMNQNPNQNPTNFTHFGDQFQYFFAYFFTNIGLLREG